MSSVTMAAREEPKPRWQNVVNMVCLWVILLTAFALRAYLLDGQSFWSDEGISLLRSQRSFADMLETMPVEQMPGYFVLLHGWLRLAGTEDFALRYLSLWPSVLAVALLYRLATALGSRRAGLIGATLLASSPFQIWYAQEARTYSWLVALGLFSSWYFWRLVSAERRQGIAYWLTLLFYGLSTAIIVYLHYYGALVPLAHACFIALWVPYRQQWTLLIHWIIGGLIGILCFLPWLPRILTIVDFPGWREPIDPWQIPWQVLTHYTVGNFVTDPQLIWLPWLYLVLMGLGVIGWWHVRRRAALFVVTSVAVPLVITFAIALQTLDFHERYSIVAAAPMLLLAGAGLAVMPLPARLAGYRSANAERSSLYTFFRWGGQFVALCLLLFLLWGNRSNLIAYYTNADLHKPDFREAVRVIETLGQDGDVVILDGPDPNIVFLHYYDAAYPVYDMRPFITVPREETYAAMTEYTANAQRAWDFLLFHEPRGVQEWLARNGWSTPTQDHNGIRLTLYGLREDGLRRDPMDLPVGDTLRLITVALPAGPVRAEELLAVSTYWQVLAPPPNYKFSLRLVNNTGEIVSAQDYVPQNWFAPTSSWPVGGEGVDRRGFLLPAHLQAGIYQITLRVYDPATGAVAETPLGQDIVLGSVEILEPEGQ